MKQFLGVQRYINLGDWIRLYTFGVFDGTTMQLLEWKK